MMLHSIWKRPKTIICFGVLVAMLIALTLRETQKTSTKLPSSKETTSTHYGDRSLGTLDNFTVKIPSDAELANMTDTQLRDFYWSYINTIQVLCRKIARVGKIEDGGKEVCTDEPFCPRPPCMVYSFGMRNNGETYKHAENVTFYMIGLDAKSAVLQNQWKMKTSEQCLVGTFSDETRCSNKSHVLEKWSCLLGLRR